MTKHSLISDEHVGDAGFRVDEPPQIAFRLVAPSRCVFAVYSLKLFVGQSGSVAWLKGEEDTTGAD